MADKREFQTKLIHSVYFFLIAVSKHYMFKIIRILNIIVDCFSHGIINNLFQKPMLSFIRNIVFYAFSSMLLDRSYTLQRLSLNFERNFNKKYILLLKNIYLYCFTVLLIFLFREISEFGKRVSRNIKSSK